MQSVQKRITNTHAESVIFSRTYQAAASLPFIAINEQHTQRHDEQVHTTRLFTPAIFV